MLDRPAQALIAPALNRAAGWLVARGLGADSITLAGFGLGLLAALALAQQAWLAGLACLLASRLCDGLDGAVARRTRPTDRGAFLDIALDFVFYASIPLAFAWADPAANALAAAALLTSFVGTGSSFLAFAVMAERRGLPLDAGRGKGLHFLGGLTEATETLACFVLMCLWPAGFALLAWTFAGLCCLTWVARLHTGWRLLADAGAGTAAEGPGPAP